MILVHTVKGSKPLTIERTNLIEVVRLAVRAAYPELPDCFTFDALAATLAAAQTPAFVFRTVEDAEAWAETYSGPDRALVAFLVADLAATLREDPNQSVDATLYGEA